MDSNPIKSICIFCGSRFGNNPNFKMAALHVGRTLAERHIKAVYGGGKVGLMGEVANAVLETGGYVSGIIPGFLAEREVALDTVQHLEIVDNMHHRKRRFLDLSDAFIVLPGGIGTFEELTEVISWFTLGLHDKPIGFLNVDGYFDSLFALFQNAIKNGFIDSDLMNHLHQSTDIESLIDKLQQHPGKSIADKHFT